MSGQSLLFCLNNRKTDSENLPPVVQYFGKDFPKTKDEESGYEMVWQTD